MFVLRIVILLTLGAAIVSAGACGGSGSAGETAEAPSVQPAGEGLTTVTGPAGSIAALLAEGPGADVALIWGTSDYAVGENRLSFLIVNDQGELVGAPAANVRVARGGFDAVPELAATAENLAVGARSEAAEDGDFDAPSVYVARLDLDTPGLYTLLVEPEGAGIQAYGQIEVADTSAAPPVGAKAPPSDTPTVEDGFPDEITTATPPDLELLQHSVKESIEDGVPFVVTFATPKFCASRVCGPVVGIVDSVRRKLDGTGIRFIHVEVFEANDPERGYNQWMREWNLRTEPYTFIVDGTGTIRGRFEGLVTAGELEQSVRDLLL